jgi:hypothetical protein
MTLGVCYKCFVHVTHVFKANIRDDVSEQLIIACTYFIATCSQG